MLFSVSDIFSNVNYNIFSNVNSNMFSNVNKFVSNKAFYKFITIIIIWSHESMISVYPDRFWLHPVVIIYNNHDSSLKHRYEQECQYNTVIIVVNIMTLLSL